MSLAVWSMTRSANRTPMLARIPPGRLSASGRWVSSSGMMPSAGPRLTIAVTSRSNSLPICGWENASWHSEMTSTSGCRPSDRLAASSGVTLFSGQVTGQLADHRGAPVQLSVHLADVSQARRQCLVVGAGPVGVGDVLQARQVPGALQFPGPDLGADVEGRVQAEQPQRHRLAHPRHRTDQHRREHEQDSTRRCRAGPRRTAPGGTGPRCPCRRAATRPRPVSRIGLSRMYSTMRPACAVRGGHRPHARQRPPQPGRRACRGGP